MNEFVYDIPCNILRKTPVMISPDILKEIEDKFVALGHDPNTMLRGFLNNKPITYWDYVEVDALLSLQKPRTDFKDEFIFIVYHQVTELLQRLVVHELLQLTSDDLSEAVFSEKVHRICRYTDVLIQSFDVMSKGMDYVEYNTFRLSLAPASGFQSVQFREIEIYSTDIIHLIKPEFREKAATLSFAEKMEFMYWKDAGLDRKTGKKSPTLKMFEDKYLSRLISLSETYKDSNLWQTVQRKWSQNLPASIREALRYYDYQFNVKWPLTHLGTAESYLMAKGQKTASTGMSDWQKYLHPSYQRRMFFPSLWSEDELKNWGYFELSLGK